MALMNNPQSLSLLFLSHILSPPYLFPLSIFSSDETFPSYTQWERSKAF